MFSRAFALVAPLVLAASACSSSSVDDADASTAPESSSCLDVRAGLGEAIAAGGDGLSWRRGAAVEVPGAEGAHYVAGVVDDGGGEVTGVWAVSSLDVADATFRSVDGFAAEFTSWPRAEDLSMADDGASAAVDCLS